MDLRDESDPKIVWGTVNIIHNLDSSPSLYVGLINFKADT
jgi:hypothetical protein